MIGKEILTIIGEDILMEDNFHIEMNEDLLTSGTLDSMALMRLVAALEEKYNIKIPPTDLIIEHFLNVQSIEDYISKRINK